MMPSKRSYHPLVLFFFYAGMIKKDQLAMIPATTLQYWKNTRHESLYGFEWVKEFYTNHHEFNTLLRHRIVFKSARICCRVLDCFGGLFSQVKGYKKTLKKNVERIISVIDNLILEMPLEKACKVFRITTNQYYRWKNKVCCSASVLNHCFKSHPSQLSVKEADVIRKIVCDTENLFKPLSTLYYSLLRNGKLYCSLGTFYKYVPLLGDRTGKRKIKNAPAGFRAARVFEYLHVDTTFVPTENEGKFRVAFVKDNFSKSILHKTVLPGAASEFIRNLLQETFVMYNLHSLKSPVSIVSDDGSENKGELLNWIDSPGMNNVVKITAQQKDFHFSNSMSESVHDMFKNDFLQGKPVRDRLHLLDELERFHHYHEHEWFPLELYGYSPSEVRNGAIPDRNRFKRQINMAQQLRYLENKTAYRCDFCNA